MDNYLDDKITNYDINLCFFDKNIRQRTSYKVPILFGEIQFNNKKTWNYKYGAKKNYFLESIKAYSENNQVIYNSRVNLIHDDLNLVRFHEDRKSGVV